VVTDPHDGRSIGLNPPHAKADLILISHNHFDHNCPSVVSSEDSSVISEPIMTVEKGVRIEGFTADHDPDGGSKRGKITIFRFELDGISFCHLGDLGQPLNESLVERIGAVDVLFVPVGGTFTIGPQMAKEVIDALAPKVAIPMHYRVPGLQISLMPVQKFLDVSGGTKTVQVGSEMEFGLDDLPEKGPILWVFSGRV